MDARGSDDKSGNSSSKKESELSQKEKETVAGFKNTYGDVQRVIEENMRALEDSATQIFQMEDMIRKMRTMQEELDLKMSELKRAAAAKNIDIDTLLGSASPLAKKSKDILRTMEDGLRKKIAEAVPQEACLLPKPKTKEELTKERLGKTRGARNKWIPMR